VIMSIKELIKKNLVGEGGFVDDDDEFVVGLLNQHDQVEKQQRKFQIPDGLKRRVAELCDRQHDGPGKVRANVELWELLNERCPESKEGEWFIRYKNGRLFLVEGQA